MRNILLFFFIFQISLMGQSVDDFMKMLAEKDAEGAANFVRELNNVNEIRLNHLNLLMLLFSWEGVVPHPDHKPFFKMAFDELLRKGIDIHFVSPNGTTALHNAVSMGIPYYVQRLLAAGADPDAMSQDGFTPLHYIFMGADNNLPEVYYTIIDLMITHGANVNQKVGEPSKVVNYEIQTDPTLKGSTYLMFAAMGGNKRLVEYLLKKGADPRIKNASGKTALDFAREGGHEEIIGILSRWKP